MIRLGLIFGLLLFLILMLFNYSGNKTLAPGAVSENLPRLIKKASPSPRIEPLTIERIFSETKIFPALDGEKVITVIATGDVIPARSTNYQTIQRKDFTWPFQKTADVLKSADLTFINLETPLMKNCQPVNEGMRFCGSSGHIEGLKFAGVDVASLANNHAANYGREGIGETKKLLEGNAILVTGLSGPVYVQVKGIKFAFLGYSDIEKTPLVSTAEEGRIRDEVAQARKNADVVIVQYHWGSEYITPPEERQIFLGKLTVDSGADLVIGNHPHWIKPVQFYNGKLITYGHGNFVFDQEWSQKTKEGVVGKYTFYGKDLIDVEFLPVEIVNYGQPYFLEGERKKAVLDEMYRESVILR
jgi:gamma-polyglutamate biosynthesis protein CapA